MSAFLRGLLWVVSGTALGLFLVLALLRMFYPLELDCIEGVIMDHAVRVAGGEPLYVEPSLSFIPLAYMPLFATAAGGLAAIFGPALWEPRLISALSTLGIVALIGWTVARGTGRREMGAGAAGVYLMGFGFTGACYDVARPDSLMLFLALSGLVVLHRGAGTRSAVASAALLTLAFFTKQHAACFAAGALAYLAAGDRRRLPAFALSILAGCVGGYVLLAGWLGPWFTFYTWDVPSHWSRFDPGRVYAFVRRDLLGSLGWLFVPALAALVLRARSWTGPGALWTWTGLAGMGAGLMATLDPSAYRHTLMPPLLGLAVLGPLAFDRLARAATSRGAPERLALGLASLLLLVQYLPLVYELQGKLPRPRALEAHARFMDELRRQHGRVLVPYHGFYDWSAGKGTSLHIIPLDDLVRAPGNRLLRDDPGYIDRMFEPLRGGPDRPAIVTDLPLERSGPPWDSLAPHYELEGTLGWITEALRPVTGNRFAPAYVYVPRAEPGPGAGSNGATPGAADSSAAGGGTAP